MRASRKLRRRVAHSGYPLFQAVLEELCDHDLGELADSAGVSKQTLINWWEGRTHSPQIRTLTAVADAMGYDIVLRLRLRVVK